VRIGSSPAAAVQAPVAAWHGMAGDGAIGVVIAFESDQAGRQATFSYPARYTLGRSCDGHGANTAGSP